MSFITITPQEFEQYAQIASHRFFAQSLEFSGLLQKRGFQVVYLAWKENHEIKVASIAWLTPMTGGKQLKIRYGPMYTDKKFVPDFLNGLKHYSQNNNILEVELNPYDIYQLYDDHGNPISDENTSLIDTYQDAGFIFGGLTASNETADWHYIKDLTGLTEKNLISSFSKKGRALIKKAKTFGIKLRRLERHELLEFKKITESTSSRRSFEDKPLEYYEYFYDSFGDTAEFMIASLNFEVYRKNLLSDQNQLKAKIDKLATDIEKSPNSDKKKNLHRELSSQYNTFTARLKEAEQLITQYGNQEVIMAASIFIFMPNESIYFLSGSYTEFNKFYAPALLQEYAMLKSIELGIPKYNLLGFSGVFDGSDGVLRFKQNFNGYIERRPGAFYYYPNPLKYKFIQALKKILRR